MSKEYAAFLYHLLVGQHIVMKNLPCHPNDPKQLHLNTRHRILKLKALVIF